MATRGKENLLQAIAHKNPDHVPYSGGGVQQVCSRRAKGTQTC